MWKSTTGRARRAKWGFALRHRAGRIDTATTGDESTMMASNEEIADDAALAGQADAFSIGDAIRWLKLGQQRRSSGDVREQAEASAMLESATQGGYMFYNSFGGVAGMYAAVEDCVRDERNRQQALQDEMEGTLEARYGMDPSQFSGGVKVAPPELTAHLVDTHVYFGGGWYRSSSVDWFPGDAQSSDGPPGDDQSPADGCPAQPSLLLVSAPPPLNRSRRDSHSSQMRVMAPDTALAGGSSAIMAFRSRKVGHNRESTRGECSGCAQIFSKKGSTRRAKTPPKVRLPTRTPPRVDATTPARRLSIAAVPMQVAVPASAHSHQRRDRSSFSSGVDSAFLMRSPRSFRRCTNWRCFICASSAWWRFSLVERVSSESGILSPRLLFVSAAQRSVRASEANLRAAKRLRAPLRPILRLALRLVSYCASSSLARVLRQSRPRGI